MSPYTKMILNPCTAPLVKGAFGNPEKTVTRVATRHSLMIPANNTLYVIWFPDFSPRPDAGAALSYQSQFSAIYFIGSSTASPLNLGGTNQWAYPYTWASRELATTNATGGFLEDPAASMNDGKYTDDLTPIAACIDVSYTGRADASAGQICLIPEIDSDQIIRGSHDEGDSTPLCAMSTDMLFSQSNEGNIFRLGGDVHTVRWAANDLTTTQDSATGAFIAGGDTVGQGTTNSGGYRTQSPSPLGIGFAIQGTDTDAPVTFTFTKIVEWSPGDWLNQVNPAPRGLRTPNMTRAQAPLPTGWATVKRWASEAFAKHATPANAARLASFATKVAGNYYPIGSGN